MTQVSLSRNNMNTETPKHKVQAFIKRKNINAIKAVIYVSIIVFVFTISYNHSLGYIKIIKSSDFYQEGIGGWLFPFEWSLHVLSPAIMYMHYIGLRLLAAMALPKYMRTNM